MRKLYIILFLILITYNSLFVVNSRFEFRKFGDKKVLKIDKNTKEYILLKKYYSYADKALGFLDKSLLLLKTLYDIEIQNKDGYLSTLCNLYRRFNINLSPQLCLSNSNLIYESIFVLMQTTLTSMRYALYESKYFDNSVYQYMIKNVKRFISSIMVYYLFELTLFERFYDLDSLITKTYWDSLYMTWFNAINESINVYSNSNETVERSLYGSFPYMLDVYNPEAVYASRDIWLYIVGYMQKWINMFVEIDLFNTVILFAGFVLVSTTIINFDLMEKIGGEHQDKIDSRDVNYFDKIYFYLSIYSSKGWNKYTPRTQMFIKQYIKMILFCATVIGNTLFVLMINKYSNFMKQFNFINIKVAAMFKSIELIYYILNLEGQIGIGRVPEYIYILISESTFLGSNLFKMKGHKLIISYIISIINIPFWQVIISHLTNIVHKQYIMKKYRMFYKDGVYYKFVKAIQIPYYILIVCAFVYYTSNLNMPMNYRVGYDYRDIPKQIVNYESKSISMPLQENRNIAEIIPNNLEYSKELNKVKIRSLLKEKYNTQSLNKLYNEVNRKVFQS